MSAYLVVTKLNQLFSNFRIYLYFYNTNEDANTLARLESRHHNNLYIVHKYNVVHKYYLNLTVALIRQNLPKMDKE